MAQVSNNGVLQLQGVYANIVSVGFSSALGIPTFFASEDNSNDNNTQSDDGSGGSSSGDFQSDFDPSSIENRSPDDLLNEGWNEVPHPAPARRQFNNSEGVTVYHDEARTGADGWEGTNHWHVENPDISSASTKNERNSIMFLDVYGNAVG